MLSPDANGHKFISCLDIYLSDADHHHKEVWRKKRRIRETISSTSLILLYVYGVYVPFQYRVFILDIYTMKIVGHKKRGIGNMTSNYLETRGFSPVVFQCVRLTLSF